MREFYLIVADGQLVMIAFQGVTGWGLIGKHHGQSISSARETSSVLCGTIKVCLGCQDGDRDVVAVDELAKTDDEDIGNEGDNTDAGARS